MATLLGEGVVMFMVMVSFKPFHISGEPFTVQCVEGPVKTADVVFLDESYDGIESFRPWRELPPLARRDFIRLCEWRLGVNLHESTEPDESWYRGPRLPRYRVPSTPTFDAKTCNAVTHPDGWFDCPGALSPSRPAIMAE